MSTASRMAALAADLSAALDLPVYAEPGAPGRGDLYAYLEAPSYLLDADASTFCVMGRDRRLDTSVVLVGAGTAPGQLSALYDAVDRLVDVLDSSTLGFMPSGDLTPGDYSGTPAYVAPIRSY